MTADSFGNRWRGQLNELRRGVHKCRGLQRAYIKYCESLLKFEILEEIDPLDKAFYACEVWWWDHFTTEEIKLYNGRPTGTGSVNHTAETRSAISEGLRRAHQIPEERLEQLQSLAHKARSEEDCVALTGLSSRALRRRGIKIS